MPTVDADPASANANSYLTVAEGDAFAAEHLYADAWTSATETRKQAAAIMATRLLNRECFLGSAAADGQPLPWPRSGLNGRNGYALADDVFPADLKLATFELALMLLTENVAADLPQAVQGLTKLKAGPVELGFRDDFEALRGLPGRVKALLVPSWLCESEPEIVMDFKVY